MPELSLFISHPVHSGQPTTAPVIITGAPGGAVVTVKLEQTRGKALLVAPQSKTQTADGSGGAVVQFSLSLSGPTPFAVLIATATDDKGTTYPPDANTVEVLP